MTDFITTTVIEIISKQLALYRKACADVDKAMKKEVGPGIAVVALTRQHHMLTTCVVV